MCRWLQCAMRIYAAVGALLGWFALALQLYLMLVQSPPGTAALLGTVITFISFFTILTNLLVALVFSAVALPRFPVKFSGFRELHAPFLKERRTRCHVQGRAQEIRLRAETAWGRFFRSPSMQAGTAVYIAIVGMVYRLLLRQLWNPQGAQWVADVLLHDAIPVGYVLYWLLFAPRAGLRWKDALDWLVYPAVYLVYILARGAVSRVYPYPFVDVNVLGYGGVLVRAAMFLLVFLGMGLIVVTVGRRIRERA
jgi:hypothetical protein